MKKFIAMISALIISFASVPVYVNAIEETDVTTNITIENNPQLWEKFLKYDLCILDYDSLTDEEKDLCKFIFETEQSTEDTIRCERARHMVAHDENIGERLTLDVIEDSDFFGVCDKYSDFNFGKQYSMHCVPDIINLDYDFTYEYWLDDDGDNRIVTNMYSTFAGLKILNNDENKEYLNSLGLYYSVSKDNINGKDYLCTDENMIKSMDEDKVIEYDGDTYYLCPDNTLTLIKSKYQDKSHYSATIEETVIIPKEVKGYPVTAIESNAFSNTKITKISLPETIEVINSKAFCNCRLLEDINFPENLKYIGYNAFGYTKLNEVKINSSELIISRGAFSEVPVVFVEVNAKLIGEYAFAGCCNLENLTFGKDVKEIKSKAFLGCENLIDINLSENIKYIGEEAFYDCSENPEPKKITIPKSVEIIGTLPLSQGISVGSSTYPSVNSLLQNYECVFPVDSEISGYYGTEAHSYAVFNNFIFTPLDDLLFGDANNDSKINIADAVSLQNHILGNAETSWCADTNKDGIIDSFDMILMRKMILNH